MASCCVRVTQIFGFAPPIFFMSCALSCLSASALGVGIGRGRPVEHRRRPKLAVNSTFFSKLAARKRVNDVLIFCCLAGRYLTDKYRSAKHQKRGHRLFSAFLSAFSAFLSALKKDGLSERLAGWSSEYRSANQ